MVELFQFLSISKNKINLVVGKQLPYRLIYSFLIKELKDFKIYTKTNLANSFTWALKSPIKVFIFFAKYSNYSIYLYTNYQNINNLTIKY